MSTLTTLTSLDKQTFSSQNNFSNTNIAPDVNQDNDFFRRKKQEDNGEIGVFSAEKYFNGVIEVDHSPRISKFNIPNKPEQINDLLPPQPKLIHPNSTALSVRSESSWNSQIAFLEQHNSLSKTNKPIKKTRKGFLAGLGCNCMCSDSDSIDVEDQHLGQISFKKGPIIAEEIHLSSVVENLEKQRKSLEVFGSPLQDRKSKSFQMETRPSIFSRRFDSATSKEDHSDSDESSSDLFEIKSVTGKVNNPFMARQGSPDAATSGCVTPTTCYAPSEASIEWSVVTASAADFSVMSDYEEISRPPFAPNFVNNTRTTSAVGDTPRRRPSILLGCNSGKAVRVPDRITNDKPPVLNDQQLRRVSDSYTIPAIRFPPANKLTEFDLTPRQRAFSTHSLPRSHPPPQSSQIFYIH